MIKALEFLIQDGSTQWFVYGAMDLIPPVLEKALAQGDQTAAIAKDLVNHLVAQGHGTLADLLTT